MGQVVADDGPGLIEIVSGVVEGPVREDDQDHEGQHDHAAAEPGDDRQFASALFGGGDGPLMAIPNPIAVLQEMSRAMAEQVQGSLLTMLVERHESDGSRLTVTKMHLPRCPERPECSHLVWPCCRVGKGAGT